MSDHQGSKWGSEWACVIMTTMAMIQRDCELQRYNVMVTIEKAVTIAPPYTERTRRRAEAALECSRNADMYQFKCGV